MKIPDLFNRNELTRVLWDFRKEFLVVGLFSMVVNLLMLTPTIYMLQVYDRVMMSQNMDTLATVSIIILFFFTVQAFAEWARSKLLVSAGVRMDEMLSKRLFQASYEAYLDPNVTNPTQAFGDLTHLRQFLTGNGIFAFFDTPWVPIYIVVLFMLHPWLGFMAILFASIQFGLVWWGGRATNSLQAAALKSHKEVTGYLQSKLRNAEVIEPMGMVDHLYHKWSERNKNSISENFKAQEQAGKVVAISKFVRYSQQSLALGGGALLVIHGELSPGGMIAANVLMSRALSPIDLMVSTWSVFLTALDSFGRLGNLLETHQIRYQPLKDFLIKGAVNLVNVTATAPGRKVPILKGVTVSMSPGSVTVVLGSSGSGKSTLARVLLGIWPHSDGDVLLDGHPIRSFDRMALGPHIGYLPQDIELFDGTIAENIARAGKVNSENVIAAAEVASLHSMILRFPKGYDTPMGEASGMLSGGQRQRIGLARALYGMPALVVLDEPNANLDDEGEAALARAVQTLKMQGKTVILISHRPGAVVLADKLLLLQNGIVQLNGPRDEVIAEVKKQHDAAMSTSAPHKSI